MRSEITAEKIDQTSANAITGIDALGRMLQYRRPAGSKTERRFIKRWLDPLGLDHDKKGNLYTRIGNSNVMWSCHTDTVHYSGGLQKIALRGDFALLAKVEKESNCLGADDTAGVWLMREMILAGKPGLYIFHREEECGGHGSSFIAKNNRGLLDGVEIAIALDRKAYTSVITHQFTRCCSDDFGYSLAAGLGEHWTLDDGGTFTDTANYADIIPECTNLSVGYGQAHSKDEYLHVPFLVDLKDQLLALDVGKLRVSRDPAIDDDDLAYWMRQQEPHGGSIYRPNHGARDVMFESYEPSYGSMATLVREYPDEVADLLETYGISEDDVVRHIATSMGRTYHGK